MTSHVGQRSVLWSIQRNKHTEVQVRSAHTCQGCTFVLTMQTGSQPEEDTLSSWTWRLCLSAIVFKVFPIAPVNEYTTRQFSTAWCKVAWNPHCFNKPSIGHYRGLSYALHFIPGPKNCSKTLFQRAFNVPMCTCYRGVCTIFGCLELNFLLS